MTPWWVGRKGLGTVLMDYNIKYRLRSLMISTIEDPVKLTLYTPLLHPLKFHQHPTQPS